ncbi:MAG TPA: class I fructose-bisphosphate aldolase [Gaiellaceae bacterium]|nr:class I fructose-bisphosphate aldolase [Gaiellaceae bacterium]
MATNELHETARAIVADNKGILAADESSGTIKKRFDSIDLESTEENRRAYRDMLFTTPGLDDFVSGVILFDETLRQSTADGTPFAKLLADRGIIPGIKVDTGAKDLAGAPGEKVTEGLDGLRERLEEYRSLGARFAKWRAVITIGEGIPTPYCIEVNAQALARYAALCQEQGLVPIVEPEVLMDADNDIETCYRATKRTLHKTFDELYHQRVDLEGMLLKPNMVISGKGSPTQASAAEVAEWTIRCFRETVPAAVPGIVFLSGGQSDEQASENLNAINSLSGPNGGPQPWVLSFSYGRALQAPALKAWGGSADNVEAGQSFLALRARCNSAAVAGRYSADMEELARSS